jgi:hypothetical protein
MRWSRTLASLLFFACAAAASAQAQTPQWPLSDVFVRFCGDTSGDADSALQRADAAGWARPPPKALTAVPFGAGKWTDLRGRWSRTDDVLKVLEVGTIQDPDGQTALVCTIAETPSPGAKADFEAIERALQDWVGGPPMKASEGFAIFAYRRGGAQRIVLGAAQNPLADGAVRMRADTALVSLVDVFGITPTITYMRWR